MLLNIYICVRDAEAGGSNPLTPTTTNVCSVSPSKEFIDGVPRTPSSGRFNHGEVIFPWSSIVMIVVLIGPGFLFLKIAAER